MPIQYNIRYTDINKTPITINEGNRDNSTDATLFGRIDLDYGQELDQDMLRLLEHFARPEDTTNVIISPRSSNGFSGISFPGITSTQLTTLAPNTAYDVSSDISGVSQPVIPTQTFSITTPTFGSGAGGAFTYGDLCEGINNGNWVSSGASNFYVFVTDDSNDAYPSIANARSNGYLIFQSLYAGYNQISLQCNATTPTPTNLFNTLTNNNCGLVNALQSLSSNGFLSPRVDYSSTSDIALRSPSIGQVWYNETRQNYYYWTGTQWSPLRNSSSVSGNSGTIYDGQQIPLPSNVSSYSECIWAVSPSLSPSQNFDYMVCSTDRNANVTMKYQLVGSSNTIGAFANFIIVGIPHSTNSYTLGPVPPAPPGITPTPTPSVTLSRTSTPPVTRTAAVTQTPASTQSPTPALPSATPAPTTTPAPTSTPAVTHSPTPRPKLSGIASSKPNGIYASCGALPGHGIGGGNQCIAIAQPSTLTVSGGTAPYKWCVVAVSSGSGGIPFGMNWVDVNGNGGGDVIPFCSSGYTSSFTRNYITQHFFSQHAVTTEGNAFTCWSTYKVVDATGASREYTQYFYPTFINTQ